MRSLFALFAMLAATGVPHERMYSPRVQRKRKPTEEEAQNAFQKSLNVHNERSAKEFPRWKSHNIGAFEIIASNPKTARKQLTFLLKSSGVEIKAES